MTQADKPLKLAYLSYRSKPTVGGQGIYTKHLTKALVELGHSVKVFSGQPYPELDKSIELQKLPSLDIFNEHFPGRAPGFWEIKNLPDLLEVAQFSAGTFSEPLAFSYRAYQTLKKQAANFDIVHDNQCLGYGILALNKILPTLVTLHHPITVDRRLEMQAAQTRWKRFSVGRWYNFVKMQGRVAKRMPRIVAVSQNSMDDIRRDMKVPTSSMRLVHVGVDPELFRPLPETKPISARLITTASADVEMKGLKFLLEALAILRKKHNVSLSVIGKLNPAGASAKRIASLGLEDIVEFTSGISDEEVVSLYSKAELAIVPSLYEGFSLPAIEAMATGTPLVSTTGGALKEVTGNHGETVLHCPPGDVASLVSAITQGLENPSLRERLGEAGRKRVTQRYTWHQTAVKTVEQYREVIAMKDRRP